MSPRRLHRLYFSTLGLVCLVVIALVATNVGGLRHDPTGAPGALATLGMIVAITGLVTLNRKAHK